MIEALDVLPSSVETKFALKSLSHQHTVEKKAFRNCKEIGLGIFRKTGYNIIHREKSADVALLRCNDSNKVTFKVTLKKSLCDWGRLPTA